MNYYELFANTKNKQLNLLTYSSEKKLTPGQHVLIDVRNKTTNGVVINKVEKPDFETNEVNSVIDGEPKVSNELLSLASWMQDYYMSSTTSVFNAILPKGLGKKRQIDKPRIINNDTSQRAQLPLSSSQAVALKEINSAETAIWLHGTTGSGKTRIYVELVEDCIGKGEDCILLVPEISLTPQLVEQFKALSVVSNIVMVHSGLTEAQRHKTWRSIALSDEPVLIIGARSALFMPVKKLGLIIIDEAHETSYYQDSQPKYSSLKVASRLAQISKAKLVFGSATPPLAELYQAKQTGGTVVELPEPVHKSNQSVKMIDLKDKTLFKRHRVFSDELIDSIQRSLDKDEQSLLLLNRRGTRQSISCQNCGWFAECPHCLAPLRYHGDTHKYTCHICAYSTRALASCDDCGQPELSYSGIGTKQIEIDIKKLFPGSNVLRYDQDAVTADTSHAQFYEKIKGRKIDIIIGTQLIAKGFDLPRLSTVGVINADTSLQLPDFSANERTFQLLYQVAGRGGRRGQDSDVFFQTYLTNNPTILAARSRDYHLFYESELKERKAAQLPPFVFIARLECELKDPTKASEKAALLANEIRSNNPGLYVFGPTPSFHEYSRGYYRRQLVVKTKKRSNLYPMIATLPSGWKFELDPPDLL